MRMNLFLAHSEAVNIFWGGVVGGGNLKLSVGTSCSYLDAASAHLHTGSLRWSEEAVGTSWANCSSSPGARRSADVCTHTRSVTHSRASFQISFPEGFDHAFRSIWRKHQHTPSEVKDFLSSFFLLAPLPPSSNTDMHPAHSHSRRLSQIIGVFYFDAPVLFPKAHTLPSLRFLPFICSKMKWVWTRGYHLKIDLHVPQGILSWAKNAWCNYTHTTDLSQLK